MRTPRKAILASTAIIIAALTVGAIAQLSVSVSNIGTVQGPSKELAFSASVNGVISATVQAFGTDTSILPACATAALPIPPATSNTVFQDTPSATVNWGTSLQSNTDYEIFFCIGNIGTSAGTVHVSTTGQAAGETEVFEQAQSTLTGLVFSPCDGATITGLGIISVRGHLHTPTVGLNGVASLTGKTTFTFS